MHLTCPPDFSATVRLVESDLQRDIGREVVEIYGPADHWVPEAGGEQRCGEGPGASTGSATRRSTSGGTEPCMLSFKHTVQIYNQFSARSLCHGSADSLALLFRLSHSNASAIGPVASSHM
jgi:hypothetical protein